MVKEELVSFYALIDKAVGIYGNKAPDIVDFVLPKAFPESVEAAEN